ELLTLHFDRQRMEQPWQDFIEETLIGEYGAVHVVCGYDFRFGARGEGTAALLKDYCAQRGVGCDCIPQISIGGQAVSSTRIRKLLQEGSMEEAVALLGHPHMLRGTVVTGRRLGRTIGIPTANVDPGEKRLLPRHGVYAAKAVFEGQTHLAVVNIGNRPTVGGTHVTVEPWLLDFEGDLYGKELTLLFYAFLRPEQAFPDLDALRREIHRNAEQTRALLG
ncbi:MAG: riboflavin biosynthesis protein RibF, partial [Oscillospiraceae bacterium]|nr:riboflavin biosynthesis protein RibF [Oscillospiraceae bacterium]